MAMSSPVVTARGLVRSHATRAGRPPVLDGVDLVAAPGTRVGLIGENGSGKSTLLRLLAGVDTPDGGTLTVPRTGYYMVCATAHVYVNDFVTLAVQVNRNGSTADQNVVAKAEWSAPNIDDTVSPSATAVRLMVPLNQGDVLRMH